MPFLQMYKGSYRVRRPVPKHLRRDVGTGEGNGQYLTAKLRQDGEPKLTDRIEASRRAEPMIANFGARLDAAQIEYERANGLRKTVRIAATPRAHHTYRLANPTDPTSGVVIDKTTMRGGFGGARYEEISINDPPPLPPEDEPVEALPIAVPEAEPDVTFDKMLDAWGIEKKKGSKAIEDYKFKCAQFAAFLRHTDMTRVTVDDGRRWKDKLVKERVIAKHALSDLSIKNYLTALRVAFKFAERNGKLGGNPNPMLGVHYTPADKGVEMRNYTPDERLRVLILAREQGAEVKWLVWLCGWLGCRIAEAADCTTHDVECIGEIWAIRIREDNRTPDQKIKTAASIRIAPLHSALIAEGFLRYAGSLPAGPLFPRIKLNKYGQRAGRASRIVADFVRTVALITDKHIHPSHSWRHTVGSMMLDRGVEFPTVCQITGHSIGGAVAKYIHVSLPAKKEAIEKLPPL
jgi:integrase